MRKITYDNDWILKTISDGGLGTKLTIGSIFQNQKKSDIAYCRLYKAAIKRRKYLLDFLLEKNGQKPLFYAPNFVFTLLNDVSLIEAGYFDGYSKKEMVTLVTRLREMSASEKQNLAVEINKKSVKIEPVFSIEYTEKLFEKRFLDFFKFDFKSVKKLVNEISNGDPITAYLFYVGICNSLCGYESFKNKSMISYSVEVEMASVLQVMDLTLTKATFNEIVEIIHSYCVDNGTITEDNTINDIINIL